MNISLKTVVVTGAGSGLGRALTFELAKRSISVMCMDLEGEGLQSSVSEARKLGAKAEALVVDVSDETSVVNGFKAIDERGYVVDGLITCAGIHSSARILDLTFKEWQRVMAVNLYGTFVCVQNALRVMIPNGKGRIVTISSDTGKRGGGRAGTSAYGASKGGVIAFTRSIARELAMLRANDLRINCVCPGPMLTPMHKGITDDFIKMVEGVVPIGRWGTPQEVAGGVLFLLCDEASYVYGETLSVDGGLIMD